MDFFKYAIVDIGANSVRMNIYDINLSEITEDKKMSQIGG